MYNIRHTQYNKGELLNNGLVHPASFGEKNKGFIHPFLDIWSSDVNENLPLLLHNFCVVFSIGNPGMFIKRVLPGSVAHNAGLSNDDRLVELNGENIEGLSHSQVVEKMKKAGSSLMFLVVDAKTDEYYKNKSKTIGVWLASIKHLPHKPRVADLSKGPTGFGFSLIYEQNKGGRATIAR